MIPMILLASLYSKEMLSLHPTLMMEDENKCIFNKSAAMQNVTLWL
jgi:hypothetical protein